jgi:hypothetical protein
MAELAATRAEVAEAAAAELEALRGSRISSSVSADASTDDELKLAREPAREHTTQWAAAHPQGRSGGGPDGRGRASGAPGGGARDGRAPDGSGSPDRGRHAGGWVDGDRDLYRRCGSPRTGTMVTAGSRPLSGMSVPALGGLPSPRPTTSSGPR